VNGNSHGIHIEFKEYSGSLTMIDLADIVSYAVLVCSKRPCSGRPICCRDDIDEVLERGEVCISVSH
jgi:hypothetical protein